MAVPVMPPTGYPPVTGTAIPVSTGWTAEPVNEEDRELLMLLGSVGIRVGEVVTGLFEDSLSVSIRSSRAVVVGWACPAGVVGFRVVW